MRSGMHQEDAQPLPDCLSDAKDILTLLPIAIGQHLSALAYVWGIKTMEGEGDASIRSKVRARIQQAVDAERRADTADRRDCEDGTRDGV